MNPVTWFLIVAPALTGGLETVPIGPMLETECRAMKAAGPTELPPIANLRCRRAYFMRSCPVDGRPGVYRECPVFDIDESR